MAAVEDELRSHLDAHEKLLWAGRPAQGFVFMPADWFLIPFSLVWLAIVVVNLWQGQIRTPQPIAGLAAALFIGLGIYLLVGRYLIDWLYRSRQIYAVTDRRAIIASGVSRRSVQSIDLSSLSGLKLEELADGSGTIFFGDQPAYSYGFYGLGFRAAQGVGTQFFRVADAKKVYTIVREAMQQHRK